MAPPGGQFLDQPRLDRATVALLVAAFACIQEATRQLIARIKDELIESESRRRVIISAEPIVRTNAQLLP